MILAVELLLFGYLDSFSIDLKTAAMRREDGARVSVMDYASPMGGRVGGYLVEPAEEPAKSGAIVFGGADAASIPEASRHARAGMVCILPAAPGGPSGLTRDRRAVTDLRRAIDYLWRRPGVDRARIYYIGLGDGASWGAILAAVDQRPRLAVLASPPSGAYSELAAGARVVVREGAGERLRLLESGLY